MDPSRLLWPTLATALSGITAPRRTEISTSACQPRTVILLMLPTMTSLSITGEFASRVPTLAISTW